ncbi:putative lipid II flippase FtsW [Hydrogenovibrio halophilus]|uniref:putative lipid II flippase FtsW n=1 Tax=Hydrogenovibrio halophilus TaxID=373391 RepID=UPI000A02070D|nr:putative lipid II flippase FtsW [Hydrogenovibrio halophilus]
MSQMTQRTDTRSHRPAAPRRPADDWPVDWVLIGAIAALMSVGLLMVASSSVAISEKYFGYPTHFLGRQALAMTLGLIAAWVVVHMPLSLWRQQRGKLFLLGLLLLVLVLIFGREVNGAKRWLPLVFMNFQVSEFMKLAVVVFMAGYLARHGQAVREQYEAVFRLMLPFGAMAILLLMEPDFGSTFVIAVIITGMLLIAGAPWRYFVITVVPIAALLVFMIITSPYRMARVSNFLDPWADPFGQGYQLTQALIALGRGEWLGVGMGESVQKLLYLPDAHTDFLFAIFAEEYGFVGVVALIGLYALILWRCFRIGHQANRVFETEATQTHFGGLVAYGVGIWVALQAMINIGVNVGLFPTKGLTLPLMSYGGSSVLMIMMALALVLRVDMETRQARRRFPQTADSDSTNHLSDKHNGGANE